MTFSTVPMPRLLVTVFLLLVAGVCHALSQDDLLPPDQAFKVEASRSGDSVAVRWQIADGYYLYRDRLGFALEPALPLAKPALPAGQEKTDPFFGRTVIYHGQLATKLTLPADAPRKLTLVVTQQGCADVGVCYPPQTVRLALDGSGGAKKNFLNGLLAEAGAASSPAAAATAAETNPLARLGWGGLLATFFVAGLGLALTACMYPMLPIMSAIVAGGGQAAHGWRGAGLALAYTQGLAASYTVVGVAAGLTGSLLSVWLQRPEVAFVAAGLLVLFALGMFDVINVQLPSAWQSRLADTSNRLGGGRVAAVFGMGALSALIVGPCVAPPLAVALGYIGATGDALKGGVALYAMALGLGAPLIVLGALGGHALPRAGSWMRLVKSVFGVAMLLLAIYLAAPFLPPALVLAAYGVVLLGAGVFAGAFDTLPSAGQPGRRALKAIGLLLALVGTAQLVGGLAGGRNPLQPLAGLAAANAAPAHLPFTRVDSAEQFDALLAANRGKPVLLDFYADWCVSCKEMETETFADPRVQAALRDVTLIQADVTANTPAHQALLARFGLYGPPGTLLFDRAGQERERLIGFVGAEPFLQKLTVLR